MPTIRDHRRGAEPHGRHLVLLPEHDQTPADRDLDAQVTDLLQRLGLNPAPGAA
jgi:hypothetical protein